MLWSLLKNAEWKPFVELLSPSFFKVVPSTVVLAEARKLSSNYFDKPAFADAKSTRRQTLSRSALRVRLEDALPNDSAPARDCGARLLELYFHQVLCGGPLLLDHRAPSFAEARGELVWAPRPVFVAIDQTFHAGIKDLYHGFYAQNPGRFSKGAALLGLADVEPALRAQFGEGDQTSVHFSLSDFQRRFTDVFAACKKARATLHPGFIGLGVGLATLYEHLGSLGGTYNVRQAFELAAKNAE
jgi:hypothetical protein